MIAASHMATEKVLLELRDVHMHFGKVTALSGVNLQIRKGEIHSVIGPNGAGKTVMMNIINGLYRPSRVTSFTRAGGSTVSALMRGLGSAWPAPSRKWRCSAA